MNKWISQVTTGGGLHMDFYVVQHPINDQSTGSRAVEMFTYPLVALLI